MRVATRNRGAFERSHFLQPVDGGSSPSAGCCSWDIFAAPPLFFHRGTRNRHRPRHHLAQPSTCPVLSDCCGGWVSIGHGYQSSRGLRTDPLAGPHRHLRGIDPGQCHPGSVALVPFPRCAYGLGVVMGIPSTRSDGPFFQPRLTRNVCCSDMGCYYRPEKWQRNSGPCRCSRGTTELWRLRSRTHREIRQPRPVSVRLENQINSALRSSSDGTIASGEWAAWVHAVAAK